MNKQIITLNPYLAIKCGLKTAIVLDQVKLIFLMQKKLSTNIDNLGIDFESLSKIIPFIRKKIIIVVLRKCLIFDQDKEVLKYVGCNTAEFRKIINLFFKRN